MSNKPIHENLDTSFVNLSALVRYLRRREFVGKINVELSGYEAEILLTDDKELKVSEHDRIAGRVAEGEEALQRLLIRAREPGGIVNVYQTLKDDTDEIINEDFTETREEIPAPVAEISQLKPFINKIEPTKIQNPAQINSSVKTQIKESVEVFADQKPSVKLPDFPFKLSNQVEHKARRINLSPQHWQTLLDLTGELLGKIDELLDAAKLDFKSAFDKACLEIADDYPFFAAENNFIYQNGKISMIEQTAATIFVGGIFEALRRILDKLGSFPKHAATHKKCLENLKELKDRRRRFYDKFSITPQIERIVNN